MTTEPPRVTSKWIDYKFIYTADDGSNKITSDRIYLDNEGNPFIPITPLLQARAVNDTKTKLWGSVSNLRKAEITYPEPANKTQEGTTRRYIPYAPNDRLMDYIKELRTTLQSAIGSHCLDYRGENRFTTDKPTRVNDDQNL